MADIVKQNGGRIMKWDPIRAMRDLLNWDPFREMAPFAAFPTFEDSTFSPFFEITENKDAFVFKADVPGVKKEDIEITTTGNRLQIWGKRERDLETKTDTVYAFERQYGTFCRAFNLPDGIDFVNAKSDLTDGVLTLMLPKKLGAQAKKIPISMGFKS
jgi:HSP20 family protein